MVACYWGTQLQIARRLITVGLMWSWVASGCRVIRECNSRLLDALAGELRGRGKESNVRILLGNATADC